MGIQEVLPVFNKVLKLEVLITLLIVLSGALVVWQHVGMDRWYILEPSEYPFISARTDTLEGGNSTAHLERTDSSVILHYELNVGYPYPFTGLQFFLGDGKTQGADFSGYDSLFFYIRVKNQNTVRLYLRGWDSSFSDLNDPVSLKFNELEYSPRQEGYPARFVPSELRVASWWVAQRGINAHKARIDISNIPLIEVQTGTEAQPGRGSMEVLRIAFKGKLISAERLYLIILLVWMAAFLAILLQRMWRLSAQMRENQKRQTELERLNSVLEIRSKDFEKMAKEDPLTGCLNRTGFRNTLFRETQKLRESGQSLSVIMFDIDHFKTINDTYGHPTGDSTLVQIANMVRSRIRTTDALVRWGGEEFVILCSDTSLINAEHLAENLRIQIAETPMIPGHPVSCSFGVTEMGVHEEVEQVFDRVDKALYRSKSNGRNRVSVFKSNND